MIVRTLNSPDAPAAVGGYSRAVLTERATRRPYISGQIPVDAAGRTPTAFADQARLVWL
jgi:2-iminobutanoate/2-iminopropanoate deaminase